MMTTILQVVALVAIILGTFFSVVGIVGMVRLPDVYARLHATGKVGVFGVVLLLIGAVAWTPLGWGRALLLIVLLMVSGPVTAHALSSAAYRIGLRVKEPVRDDLREI
ncbi:MAG: monovalent cation/H(+) antiporter subunit G [Chloroflexi bacterium]|nr:monovalent cation/H(+) antiporter subunit G [Chloroflexota bacterium]MBP7044516.1 monovalent cation/H(+) antiporter subunit G [Chloroflexota bacterium]